ncbi:MAG: hypothetical protein CSA65_00855, partial [Proteobacteria bacterium]
MQKTEEPLTKKPSRDLSDLKARLGLAKPGGDAAKAPAPAPTPGAAPAPSPVTPAAVPPPGAAAVPPPGGVVAPPGMAPPQPVAAPPPDQRRDPFSAAGGQIAAAPAQAQVITDQGPLIDIPKEEKKPFGLIIGVAIVALVAVGVGYAFGGVMHSRKVYNKTVDDAQKIKDSIGKLADVTKKVIDAANEARTRVKATKKVGFDQKLVDALSKIQASNPLAKPENAKKLETKLFRTNYALMDNMLINRLFKYFNNSLRLLVSIDAFVNYSEKNKKKIEAYLEKVKKDAPRNYGMYFAVDKGKYFIGGLTMISQPVCPDKKAWNNRDCQMGFLVSATGEKWTWRPGKPNKEKRTKLADIVVPLPPNDPVMQGLTGKPGRLVFVRYMQLYRQIQAIAALLNHDYTGLKQDLAKQAGKV